MAARQLLCSSSSAASADDLQVRWEVLALGVSDSVNLSVLQAFAEDDKLLQLLKTLVSKHSSLADTPASELSADQVKQLQQLVKDAEVNTPDAFKLDAAQVGCAGWCPMIGSWTKCRPP